MYHMRHDTLSRHHPCTVLFQVQPKSARYVGFVGSIGSMKRFNGGGTNDSRSSVAFVLPPLLLIPHLPSYGAQRCLSPSSCHSYGTCIAQGCARKAFAGHRCLFLEQSGSPRSARRIRLRTWLDRGLTVGDLWMSRDSPVSCSELYFHWVVSPYIAKHVSGGFRKRDVRQKKPVGRNSWIVGR